MERNGIEWEGMRMNENEKNWKRMRRDEKPSFTDKKNTAEVAFEKIISRSTYIHPPKKTT